jgi:hypothetical protein
MSEICSCESTTLGNMGVPGCLPIAKVAKKMILAPYLNSDGVVQHILTSATLDQAYFDDHFQEFDSTDVLVPFADRWYMTPFVENVENTRSETIFQTFNSGRKAKVRQGVRSLVGFIVDEDGGVPEMLKQLKKFGCQKMGVLFVDQDDNLIGNTEVEGRLNFIQVDKNSFDPTYTWGTDTEVPMVGIAFDFGNKEYDHDLGMIGASDIDISLLNVDGLLSMDGTFSSPTQTSLVIDIFSEFGSIAGRSPIPGLVAADFTLYNVTDAGAVAIVSVVEDTTVPGRYTVTYGSQTLADVLRLTPNKNGFDGSKINAKTTTVAA